MQFARKYGSPGNIILSTSESSCWKWAHIHDHSMQHCSIKYFENALPLHWIEIMYIRCCIRISRFDNNRSHGSAGHKMCRVWPLFRMMHYYLNRELLLEFHPWKLLRNLLISHLTQLAGKHWPKRSSSRSAVHSSRHSCSFAKGSLTRFAAAYFQ